MIDNVDELRDKAVENKVELKKQSINVQIGDEEYDFRITGIGAKSVKLEKYVKYDDIIEALENGNDNGLEAIINQIIDDYEEEIPEDAD